MSFFDFIKDKNSPDNNISSENVPFAKLQRNVGDIDIDKEENYALGQMYGNGLEWEEHFKNEEELIAKYMEMARNPYVAEAIDDVVNEAIVVDSVTGGEDEIVTLNLEETKIPDAVKTKVIEEFENIKRIIDLDNEGQALYRKFYTAGKQFTYTAVDSDNEADGISRVVFLDPAKIKRVQEYEYEESKINPGNQVISKVNVYYLYRLDKDVQEKRNFIGATKHKEDLLLFPDESVSYVHSGIEHETNNLIVSNLHKAIKPMNQLEQLEDSKVIYQMVRAPEKRIFYIGTGNLNQKKSEQFVQKYVDRFRTTETYNVTTGKVMTKKNLLQSLYSDWFFPRRAGDGASTEVDTLESSLTLGEMDDVEWYKAKLYKALNIPNSRRDPEALFTLGRAAEITRDELKFVKFVQAGRKRWSQFFIDLLATQLSVKNVMSREDWQKYAPLIRFEWNRDNYYEELKESEILANRMQILSDAEEHLGKYFTRVELMKHVLRMTEDEIKEKQTELEEFNATEGDDDEDEDKGGGFGR